MKSGTISGRELRQRRPARPPTDYVPLLAAAALVLMIGLWLAGRLVIEGPTAVAAPTPVLVAAASPTLPPVFTTPPTPSPSPTPIPTPTQSLPPTPLPTAVPTAQPAQTFAILSPADGVVVNVGGIVVEGLAAPGAPITWDRPMWFDDHTVADADGHWSFVIGLNPGDNVMTFRVGDDVTTAQTITVRYQQ